MRRVLVSFVLLAGCALPVLAQTDTGPKAGSWGAEAASGSSASLLRFRSPSSAWVLGFNAFLVSEDADADATSGRADLRLGVRKYRRVEERVRPYTTLSALVGYDDFGENDWRFGAAVDMGAAYFFSSHASLGAAADLSVTYRKFNRDLFSGPTSITQIVARLNGVNLIGAVYF